MDRLSQNSLHPMIKFRVVGYRAEDAGPLSMAQTKPKPVSCEAKREYHIGVLYPHKPVYEGVLYKIEYNIAAFLSEEYTTEMFHSCYTDNLQFNIYQLTNCPHCSYQGKYEVIDERRAPGA